jgi:hypothetical protein
MKTFLLISFLTCIVFQSHAQQIQQDKEFYFQKSEKYRKMKSAGRALTLGGSVLSALGMITLLNSSTTTTSNGYGQSQTSTEGNVVGGALMYLFGSACVGAGVPLWIVGGINEGRYNRKLEGVSLELKLNPQTTGLALTYRF